MLFRSICPCLCFMGTELELEHIAKDLGVILDTNLTDDEHISKTFPSW